MAGTQSNNNAPMSVASLAELAATPAGAFAPGTEIPVIAGGVITHYTYLLSGTPNGSAVIAANGGGFWVAQGRPNGGANSQAAWFIDSVAGNDANDGATALTALRTNAELMRRWGLDVLLTGACTLTYVTGTPITDPLSGTVRVGAGATFAMVGTPTVVRASTFTAVTAINRATAQPLHVTDGATDWSADVGRQLIIVGGARAGMRAYIAKNVGGGVGRLSPLTLLPVADYASPTLATPSVGDAYQVRTLPTIYLGNFQILAGAGGAANPTGLTNSVTDLAFAGTYGIRGTFRIDGSMGNVNACKFDGVRVLSDHTCSYSSCSFLNGTMSGLLMFAGLSMSNGFFVDQRVPSPMLVDLDHLVQGTQINLFGGTFFYGAICVMDFGTGMYLDGFATVQGLAAYAGVCSYWGTCTGQAINVLAGGRFRASAAPVINAGLGLGREIRVGATNKLFTDLPYVDPTTQSYGVIA